jgi:hypothetical protein
MSTQKTCTRILEKTRTNKKPLRYFFRLMKKVASTGKDVEKLELLCTAGENEKWYGYYGKHCDESSKYLK